jgi:hypothetical protein
MDQHWLAIYHHFGSYSVISKFNITPPKLIENKISYIPFDAPWRALHDGILSFSMWGTSPNSTGSF